MPGHRIGDISSIDKRFLCSYCHLVLLDSVQVRCGHRFCTQCANECKKQLAKCPMCLQEDPNDAEVVDQIIPDKAMDRELMKLSFQCPNDGCQESMSLEKLTEHLSRCPFRMEPCSQCKEEVSVNLMGDHKVNQCKNRLVPCSSCHQLVEFSQMNDHLSDECVGKRQPCLFCLEMIPDNTERHQKHLDEECPASFSSGCPYGCTGDISENHRITHSTIHLDRLLARSMGACSSGNVAVAAASSSSAVSQEYYPEHTDDSSSGTEIQFYRLRVRLEIIEKLLANVSHPEIVKDLAKILTSGEDFRLLHEQIEKDFAVVVDRLQDSERNLQRMLEQKPEVENSFNDLLKLVAYKDLKIHDLECRIDMLQNQQNYGELVWKIGHFARHKKFAMEKNAAIFSPPFHTSQNGYKLCIRLYINGDADAKNNHISLYLVVMRGPFDALLPWPFSKSVTFELINQKDRQNKSVRCQFKPDISKLQCFGRPAAEMNQAAGITKFVSLSDISSDGYVVDDVMFIRASVDTVDLPF